MTPSFPRTKGRALGYSLIEVDDFINQARTAFNTEYVRAVGLTSSDIRTVSFAAQSGGYLPSAVDSALDRLETAFAERERTIAIASVGEANWTLQGNEEAAVLASRFARKNKKRFNRAGFFERGYSVKDVDGFSKKVLAYFEAGAPLGASEVRSVAFGSKVGGYEESQVDAVLDALIALLLARGQY